MFLIGRKTVTLDIKCSTAVFEAAMIAAHLQIDENTNTYNPEGKNLQEHKKLKIQPRRKVWGPDMNLQEHEKYNPEGKFMEELLRIEKYNPREVRGMNLQEHKRYWI